MWFAYLDEFGHIGPFVSRSDPKHNASPVFGLAGILLPEAGVRTFATRFLQFKEYLLNEEIKRSGKISALWEKKGSSLFTARSITKYESVKKAGFRLINMLDQVDGKIFYYGREKISGIQQGLNPKGLYNTVLAHSIRKIDDFSDRISSNFVIVVDEHSARKELLVTAAKTMFGRNPARRLSSPPFEVESYVNQNIQAADWIATIIGRIQAYEMLPSEFADHEPYWRFFSDRVTRVSTHSSMFRRRKETDGRGTIPGPLVGHSGEQTTLAIGYQAAQSRRRIDGTTGTGDVEPDEAHG
jgi:hypothetical protein